MEEIHTNVLCVACNSTNQFDNKDKPSFYTDKYGRQGASTLEGIAESSLD